MKSNLSRETPTILILISLCPLENRYYLPFLAKKKELKRVFSFTCAHWEKPEFWELDIFTFLACHVDSNLSDLNFRIDTNIFFSTLYSRFKAKILKLWPCTVHSRFRMGVAHRHFSSKEKNLEINSRLFLAKLSGYVP